MAMLFRSQRPWQTAPPDTIGSMAIAASPPSTNSIDVDRLRFVPGEVRLQRRCSVCGCAAQHPVVLEIPSLADAGLTLTLLHCTACGSMFYEPPGIRDFSDLGQLRDDFWRFYVEVGGGVWETIWPILAGATRGSLLDIGCGFGFALDFWTRTGRGEACGVELADYGAIGAQKLGVTIYSELLEQCAPLSGRRFDIVYASEVIEHVPDPRAFVALLARWVADDGVLILTTPNAAFITRENRSTSLMAALAPGFHGFLLSPQAFEAAARAAGFSDVGVLPLDERLFLWASRRKIDVDLDFAALRVPYFQFLEARLDAPGTDISVWQGYAYRYLRDLVNTREHAEGQRVADLLCASVAQSHGMEALDPAKTCPRLAAAVSLTEIGRIGPFFLPGLYYLLANLAQRWRGDKQRARALYEGAVAAIEACSRVGSIFYVEAISAYWPACVALAKLDLKQGRLAEAAETAARLAATGDDCIAANAFAVAPASLTEGFVPVVADTCIGRGAWREAVIVNDAYRGYVARRYGEAMLDGAGIEAALASGAVMMPSDPLFPVWFEGARAAAEAGGRAPDSVALHAVIRLGEKFGAHPTYGERVRELAARARACAGIPQPKVVFDMTYTLQPPGR
jgi:SAM-dependent methyltransferase